MTVRRIEPISLARITGIIYAIIGLIVALPAGCMAAMVGTGAGEGMFFGGLGILLVVVYPVVLGVVGLIGGLITALIYNFVAGRFGGVVLEVEHEATGTYGYGVHGETPPAGA